MSNGSEVIVIGGGINGVVTAFHLAQRGVPVTLIEKETICAGPTALSCGIIRQHYSHRITAQMAFDGLQIFRDFDERVGGDCDFRQCGFLLTARQDTFDILADNVSLQQSVGIDTRMVSADEIPDIEPHAQLEGIVGGAYEPGAGYADAYAATTAYAGRAMDMGAKILTETRVLSIDREGSRITGVTTDQGFIPAGAVMLAAGPWATGLLEPLGIRLPIEVGRVQVGLFDKPGSLDTHGIFADTHLGIYSRPEGELMLVGSVETKDAELVVDDPDFFNEAIDFDRVESYSDRIMRRYPEMDAGAFHNGYASLYDITTDWQPILGLLPGADNLYGAIGSSGHGFKLAPSIGELMAALIAGEEVDQATLDFFSPERFEAGVLADGRYGSHKILA